MKNILFGFLITFILALIFEIIGIWQAMVVAGILGGLMVNRSWQAFLVGFSSNLLADDSDLFRNRA